MLFHRMVAERWLSWAKSGGFAILDQGLFGGANFLVNILLARWLSPTEYGAFAVTFSVFLAVAMFHTAVLTEPMLIFGASKYADRFPKYLGLLLYGHWAGTGVIASLLALTAWVFGRFGSASMSQALEGLAIALPSILFLWLLRRAFYVRFQPWWAAVGGMLYLLWMVAGMYALHRGHKLSVVGTFAVMGAASLVGGLLLMAILRPQWRWGGCNFTAGMVLADHWEYGSWNVVGQTVYWFSGQILMVLMPIFIGLHATAIFAAVYNLFRPLNPLVQSVTILMLPIASRLFGKGSGDRHLEHQLWGPLWLGIGGVFFYGMGMTLFANPLLHFLYKGRYDGYALLVLLCALSSTASTAVQSFSVVLKASGNIRLVVFIWMIPAALTTLLAIPMMRMGGLVATLTVFTLSYLVAAVVAWKQVTIHLMHTLECPKCGTRA
jgi:O-antigen/teichoic acid export membrane protein